MNININNGLAAAVFTKDVSNALFMSNRCSILRIMVMGMTVVMVVLKILGMMQTMMTLMVMMMMMTMMLMMTMAMMTVLDLFRNSLRAGTVWVNCYDVLEAQVIMMMNIVRTVMKTMRITMESMII